MNILRRLRSEPSAIAHILSRVSDTERAFYAFEDGYIYLGDDVKRSFRFILRKGKSTTLSIKKSAKVYGAGVCELVPTLTPQTNRR